MKKFLSVLLCVSLIMSVVVINVSATDVTESPQMSVSEMLKSGEIKEMNDDIIVIEYDRKIRQGFSMFSLNNTEIHKKDSCAIVLDGTVPADDMVELLATTTSSETDSYSGAAATLYSTINYSVTTGNSSTSYDYIRLLSASGRVVKFNSLTTVTQNEVRLGTIGMKENGVVVELREDYFFPNAYSWSVEAPSEFPPVAVFLMNEFTFVGCNYICTVKRGTANIQYSLSNNVYES